ncbi:IS607 family transposase [Planktothricoides raciborskii]|uniref:IS607 family transposase n=1 Tax=Planktothricoides raciborskii GIHE-MW2 TaxID=2792601 RepID=A0AAU8JNT2_9CYAN
MKLSDYAKSQGISYRTAWHWWKQGLLKGHQLPNGTIIIDVDSSNHIRETACIYVRVPSVEDQDDLDRQANRLTEIALAKGYGVKRVVKEVASGLNDHRKQLISLLKNADYTVLMIANKDHLTLFGSDYLIILLDQLGKKVEIIEDINNQSEDLVPEFMAALRIFSQKIYGKSMTKLQVSHLLSEFQKQFAPEEH